MENKKVVETTGLYYSLYKWEHFPIIPKAALYKRIWEDKRFKGEFHLYIWWLNQQIWKIWVKIGITNIEKNTKWFCYDMTFWQPNQKGTLFDPPKIGASKWRLYFFLVQRVLQEQWTACFFNWPVEKSLVPSCIFIACMSNGFNWIVSHMCVMHFWAQSKICWSFLNIFTQHFR